jgi:hypothetical protein
LYEDRDEYGLDKFSGEMSQFKKMQEQKNDPFLLIISSLLLLTFFLSSPVSGDCPLVCICKWKGGKQTVSKLD